MWNSLDLRAGIEEDSLPPSEDGHLSWRQNISLGLSLSPTRIYSHTFSLPDTLALICSKLNIMHPTLPLSGICCRYYETYKHQVSTHEHRSIKIY